MDIPRFKQKALVKSPQNKVFLQGLKRKNPRLVDDHFHKIHNEVFDEINCLTCANCCKTTSPIFYQNDIERVARALKLKPGEFIEKYLTVDSDKDYVLKTSPCPFLDDENYCMVYEARPKACREYPHTDRKKVVQITELTYKNSLICPAVLEILERLKTIPEFKSK
jgi:uncharacterized protein